MPPRPLATEQEILCHGYQLRARDCATSNDTDENTLRKEGGIVAFHAYQSFAQASQVTPQQAHSIGMELARRFYWAARFEVVVATHLDKEHIHCHFVINSVSFKDGKRLQRL